MNDSLPGSSYYNPIEYRNWKIYINLSELEGEGYSYVHKDYDHLKIGDDRFGWASSVERCKFEIDALESEKSK